MIDRLKAYYGDHITFVDTPHCAPHLAWFQTKDNNYIGIDKKALSSKDFELLSIFLTPYQVELDHVPPEKAYWHKLLFQNHHEVLHEEIDAYIQFIHFSLAHPIQAKHEFEETLKGLYHSNVVIVWENDYDGVLIEKFEHLTPHEHNLDVVIDVLISDFNSKMQFFEGQTHRLPIAPGSQFQLEKNWFHLCKQVLHHKKMIRITDVFAYLLLTHTPDSLKKELQNAVSQVAQDEELLKTVKMYLECNLNVSLTSKKLYMHRNSLQYRIDKFIEKTGIDIKHFQGAVAAYLSILAKEAEES
ncbi:PucR family transcriptional regulator [Bacillus songklensis]|uniref:PucR family transcriptional regulator n=1 Tax=Bacillus songklensis TaxID=1069116 RepID=A0ABV8B3U8_9BACI